MLMLWENGHMKIKFSGKSKSEHLSQHSNFQMKHEAHAVWNGNHLHTLHVKQMNVDRLSRN